MRIFFRCLKVCLEPSTYFLEPVDTVPSLRSVSPTPPPACCAPADQCVELHISACRRTGEGGEGGRRGREGGGEREGVREGKGRLRKGEGKHKHSYFTHQNSTKLM